MSPTRNQKSVASTSRQTEPVASSRNQPLHFFDFFHKIRIINLPERTDRRKEMIEELKLVGLLDDERVAFFEAIKPSDAGSFHSAGARGVYESHRQLVTEAAENDESVLILEDDCSFTARALTFTSDSQWDIFYGGYWAKNPHDLENSDIQESHIMGFSARGAKLLADYLHNLEFEGIHPSIDAAYVWFRRKYPYVPTLFATPPLAYQRPSRSDIAPKPWDRFALTRGLAANLRKVRASLKAGH